ncbi:MAG: phosphoglucomutase [Planctomycetes bacterium]|nr:phosphoglucomutase [Planctomycetota bacterium]
MNPKVHKLIISIMILFISFAILNEFVLTEDEIRFESFVKIVVVIVAVLMVGMMFLSPGKARKPLNLLKVSKGADPSFRVIGAGDSKEAPPPKAFYLPESSKKTSANATPKLFGTAGIRGLTNLEITPTLALKISHVYADWLGNKGTVAIGHDTRYGADMLARIISGGLLSGGINILDCGTIPTGGIAHYIVSNKLAGGVLITGSHMPYNTIGIIVMMADGAYIPEEVAHSLEERFARYEIRNARIMPEAIGEYKQADNPIGSYKEFLLGCVDRGLIKQKKYKVLVDPANGTASMILPDLLRELGCEVKAINDNMQPVPERSAEPRAINLKETAAKVTEYGCDIGIATDIDADRVLFIDEAGTVLSEDLVGAIFTRSVFAGCNDEKLCVTPINSSGLAEHTCGAEGVKLEYCPIGQPATLKVIKNLRASFSYEESGKYYFARQALWPDGILASLKIIEIMAKANKKLSVLAGEFPRFYQVKHTIKCDNQRKDKVMKKVFDIWQREGIENKVKDITIDGLKRVYQDKSWMLIRASGTEPLIRVYADAISQERAEELVRIGEDIVKKAMEK